MTGPALRLNGGVCGGNIAGEGEGAMSSEREGWAGRQLGPLRLLKHLGEGGMGTVYEAEDVRLGRRVAVKILPKDAEGDPEPLRRFLREATFGGSLDHPNNVQLHEINESEGTH